MKNLTFRYSVTQFSHWRPPPAPPPSPPPTCWKRAWLPGRWGCCWPWRGWLPALPSRFSPGWLTGQGLYPRPAAARAVRFLRLLLWDAADTGTSAVAHCSVLRPWHLEQRCDVAAPERSQRCLQRRRLPHQLRCRPESWLRGHGSVQSGAGLCAGQAGQPAGCWYFCWYPGFAPLGLSRFPALAGRRRGKGENTTSIPVFFRKYPVYCVCLLALPFWECTTP